MRTYPMKDGWVKIHMEDADNYEVTDDNGVGVYLNARQINAITKRLERAP